jgi:superfamily II DNA or RNA helicase
MIDSASFLDPKLLVDGGPHRFVNQIERLLVLLDFKDIQNVDGPGDGGADILATRKGTVWVFQSKWQKNPTATISPGALDELKNAILRYRAGQGALVTNARISENVRREAHRLQQFGLAAPIVFIDGSDLQQAIREVPSSPVPIDLHRYQLDAFTALTEDLKSNGRALLILATGLGKTVIANEVIKAQLELKPDGLILVLAHQVTLVKQLERASWRQLSSATPTALIDGSSRPDLLRGVVFATRQSAVEYVRAGLQPALIVVDEAHNYSESGEYREIFDRTPSSKVLGLTATPWRQDNFDIREAFGEPSYQKDLLSAIREGFLSKISYKLFINLADWEKISELSKNSYSIADLNRRLFLPQLDERIRDHIVDAYRNTRSPKVIVFCSTIEHAERMVDVLEAVFRGRVAALHTGISASERASNLASFRVGKLDILVSVDMLNEGIDVPDVNILVFARVTHTRKIFVQQLGRGLRVAKDKTHVTVLDFVSDIRRMRAASDISTSVAKPANLPTEAEEVWLPPGSVDFICENGSETLQYLAKWIEENASLEDRPDDFELTLPTY